MFHMALHMNQSRPEPVEEPFVFDPECHDGNLITAAAWDALREGGHATFTLAAFGVTLSVDGATPDSHDETLIPIDFIWDAQNIAELLSDRGDGEHTFRVIEQGTDVEFQFVKRGDTVTVTCVDLYGLVLTDKQLRRSRPAETHPAADLLAEVRQVCHALVVGGVALDTIGIHHAVVHAWCLDLGIPRPGAA